MSEINFTIEDTGARVPAGIYAAEFISYEVADHKFQDGVPEGQVKKQVKFTASLTDEGSLQGTEIWGWCTLPLGKTLSPKSKLAEWSRAILGDAASNGTSIDIEDLLRKPCQIAVAVIASNQGDGSESWSKIKTVYSSNKTSEPQKEGPEESSATADMLDDLRARIIEQADKKGMSGVLDADLRKKNYRELMEVWRMIGPTTPVEPQLGRTENAAPVVDDGPTF